MNRNEKQTFKMSEMVARSQFSRPDPRTIAIHLDQRTKLDFFGINFKEDVISRMDIFKTHFDSRDPSIFVECHMGNLCIATKVCHKDVCLEIEYAKDSKGIEYVVSYYVREERDIVC